MERFIKEGQTNTKCRSLRWQIFPFTERMSASGSPITDHFRYRCHYHGLNKICLHMLTQHFLLILHYHRQRPIREICLRQVGSPLSWLSEEEIELYFKTNYFEETITLHWSRGTMSTMVFTFFARSTTEVQHPPSEPWRAVKIMQRKGARGENSMDLQWKLFRPSYYPPFH